MSQSLAGVGTICLSSQYLNYYYYYYYYYYKLLFNQVTLYVVNTFEQYIISPFSIIFDSNIRSKTYNNNRKKESCVFLSGLMFYMHMQLTVTF